MAFNFVQCDRKIEMLNQVKNKIPNEVIIGFEMMSQRKKRLMKTCIERGDTIGRVSIDQASTIIW